MNTITIATSQNKASFFLSLFENIFAKIEQLRIRTHLRIVEQELRRKNVEHLSVELQKERTKNIVHLHEYWSAGLFPQNTDFLDKRIPYFKDQLGTPCAMAYLIEQSGHKNLVNEVACINNHVYINDIQDGPIMDWINKSGLTKEEAARVQPGYDCGTPMGGPCGEPVVQSVFFLLPWIVGGAGFVVLELLSYKISSWLALGNSKRRITAWLYFTINNVVLAIILGFLTYALYQEFFRY